jgi:hypothetical protein
MANIPGISYQLPSADPPYPIHIKKDGVIWNLNNTTTIVYNDTKLYIHHDGQMILDGNTKDAALALIKCVVINELSAGAHTVEINGSLRVDRNKISYLLKDKPEFWDQLSEEFDRLMNLKVFW